MTEGFGGAARFAKGLGKIAARSHVGPSLNDPPELALVVRVKLGPQGSFSRGDRTPQAVDAFVGSPRDDGREQIERVDAIGVKLQRLTRNDWRGKGQASAPASRTDGSFDVAFASCDRFSSRFDFFLASCFCRRASFFPMFRSAKNEWSNLTAW